MKGRYNLTNGWGLELPAEFKERVEDGSHLLSRPGLKVRIQISTPRPGFSRESTYHWRRGDGSDGPVEEFESIDEHYMRFAKLCYERTEDAREWVFYSYTFERDASHVILEANFDAKEYFEMAKAIWLSVRREPPG